MSIEEDFYKILGVFPSASQAEIQRRYRYLAMQHHPDLHQGCRKAEALFKKIQAAYATLSNPEGRALYDRSREEATLRAALQKGWGFGSFVDEVPPRHIRPLTPPLAAIRNGAKNTRQTVDVGSVLSIWV